MQRILDMKARTTIVLAVTAGILLCGTDAGARKKDPVYKDSNAPVEARVEDLLSRMTLEEKVAQLTQTHTRYVDNENNYVLEPSGLDIEYGSYIYYNDTPEERNSMQRHAMEETRLGIPILFGFDVIHGYRTVYPIPLAQAASFNPSVAQAGARMAAEEAYRAGIDWTFSPMIDIARDGRWGRISEGYGEDPFLASEFCKATVRGYQGEDLSVPGNIAACLKHYIGYGASEAGRDYVSTDISDQALWDTYLPPYQAGVENGAATVMSSFNTINGVPATACRHTLEDILRTELGFGGVVVSDWQAILQIINQGVAGDGREAACLAFNAGVDMDMTDDLYPLHLPSLVESGEVSMEAVDRAVRRVLELKFRLGLFDNPYRDEDLSGAFLRPEYRETALEIAVETMVMLKNEGDVLPLKGCRRIALVGPLAEDRDALMGNWNGRGKTSDIVNIREGLASEFQEAEIMCARGCDFEDPSEDGFEEALSLARQADVTIVCLGEKSSWSGENCSRSTIALPPVQERFLERVKSEGGKVVVLLSSGRPLDLVRIEPLADAMVEIWQPGVEGGNAVAGVLSGRFNPSGRLPVTFPYATGQIPIYYNRRNPARAGDQGRYQDIPSTPMYEFGYGLSYSSFSYSPMEVEGCEPDADGVVAIPIETEKFTLSMVVENTSVRDGAEAVLWYVTDPYCRIARPVKELRHFEKRMIAAGESSVFSFEVSPLRDFGFVGPDGKRFVEKGEYVVTAGDRRLVIVLQ